MKLIEILFGTKCAKCGQKIKGERFALRSDWICHSCKNTLGEEELKKQEEEHKAEDQMPMLRIGEQLSSLDKAVQNRMNGDELPPEYHQSLVHHVDKRYLQCLVTNNSEKRKQLALDFECDPLFGLEVTDEALVLYKNDPSSWSMGQVGQIEMASQWETYYKTIVQLREGRPRATTTPTLRGGGKREALSQKVHPSEVKGQRIPILGGLKQLYLLFQNDQLSSPSDFSRSARIMQGL